MRGSEKPCTAEQGQYHLAFVDAASLAGIVGVNLSPARRERA
ncbi:hypothetical protein P9711_16905 [Anoxybacillus geothermalis]|nr:hypothetical protein [Anoxybacillus geothermalis]